MGIRGQAWEAEAGAPRPAPRRRRSPGKPPILHPATRASPHPGTQPIQTNVRTLARVVLLKA